MDKTEVKELMDYRLGDEFTGPLMIKEATLKTAKNGNLYLVLKVGDKSGELSGNVWNVTEDALEDYPVGGVVMVSGRIGEYNDKLQMDYSVVNLLADDVPEADPSLYIKSAPFSTNEMIAFIKGKLDEIEHEDVHHIVRHILNHNIKQVFTHAAAKANHHAFRGGLAYHTMSMLNLAETVATFYPDVDKSMLYAGVILHDIGKIEELEEVELGSEYTKKGKLLGHISMMESEIVKTALELEYDPDSENILLLRHMILSHHGRTEWGSPVVPQTREAQALHYIDLLDARMNSTEEALIGVDDGEFSQKIWSLGTQLYKPKREE